jgi:PAS domain S-box-containing protein
VACTIGSDHVRGAELSAAYLVERLGGQGKVAHLHGPFTSQPGVQRMQGFHQVVDRSPEVQIVLEAGGEWMGDQAAQLTRQALAAHPDLRGIFAANDPMALAAVAVLEAAGRANQVTVVGFDAAPDALLAVHTGRLAATVRQSARAMGQQAVDTALQVGWGEPVPPVILTEVTLVTAENVVAEALDSLSLVPGVLRDLTKSSAVLAAERNLLRTLIDNMPDYIYVKDTASRFVGANIAVAKLMGAETPDNLIGKADLDFYPPDLAAQYYADEQTVIQTGQPLIDHEEWVIDQHTGQPRWLSSTKVPLRDSEGSITGLVGISRDITERKQAEDEIRRLNLELEQRVAERTAELAAANRELEAFSYTVSHDLRAPLRAIDGFSRILLHEHAAQLNADAQHYLQRVRQGTQRMGQLIDDLLGFSRFSRQPLVKRPVALAELVQQVLDELRPEYDQRQVDFRINELPTCQADPALLKQVLVNLLSNALKYTRGRDPARIEIGAQPSSEGPIYFVRDNGVGFNMRVAQRLFGVFERLHPPEEFEGTGVGLGIVQRIIQRHGGRVWAEGEVGKGATFYFTL